MQIKPGHIVAALLVIIFALLAWVASSSMGTEGGQDSYMHYLIARYAFIHPENFFHHWGKPLFTLLCAPFAQGGFIWAKIFNCLAGVVTAWFVYKTAERLEMKTAIAGIFLLLFSPLYFSCLNSSLTEITFSLVLAAGIYCFAAKRYVAGAVILSFLPFARTEGFIILVVAAGFYFLQKKYWQILLLGTGVAAYSIAGYFYYHDILWVFTQNPYSGNANPYGSGSFWHFANGHRSIFGVPVQWLFVIGFISFLLSLARVRRFKQAGSEPHFMVWSFIVCSALSYWFAHSFVWWAGIQNSAGLIRVMAGIMPPLALIALRGLEAIYKPLVFNTNLRLALVATILFFVVQYPFQHTNVFPRPDEEVQVIEKAGEWYKTSAYTGPETRVFYFAPTVGISFNIDPFNDNKRAYLDGARDSKNVAPGSLVVYDTHFGPLECHIPFEEINTNPDYELVQHFGPVNNHPFEVYIYRRR